ncbi:hypothetical protein [Porphyromonas loveana]|uniref:hypothetical protein n=1 Tax=Porphyromonas loveana TaxID=1884669 RepID=UPI0035A01900
MAEDKSQGSTNVDTFTLEELAHRLKECKDNGKKPIFLIGAGFSVSGGIPLAKGVVEDVKKIYPHHKDKSVEYPALMSVLTDDQRRRLFKDYIDNSWINTAHMYLAKLYADEYIDFILTTNFDDLILQALAVLNKFPPTYDMTLIHEEDLGTSGFETGSIFYFHGQRHGLYHLHTKDQMERVKTPVNIIFGRITSDRPWIVIGYSGDDPILERMCKISPFNSGLYWVTHDDQLPDKVKEACEKGELKGLRQYQYSNGADMFMHELYQKLYIDERESGIESGIDFKEYKKGWDDKIDFFEKMATLYKEKNKYLDLTHEERAKFEKLMIEVSRNNNSKIYNTNLAHLLKDIQELITNEEVLRRLFKSNGILDEINNQLGQTAFGNLKPDDKTKVLGVLRDIYEFFLENDVIQGIDREKICRLYAAIGYSRYENDKAIDDLENVHEKLLGLQNGITDVDTYILWDKILDALIEQETNADKKGIYQSQRKKNNQAKVALEGEKEETNEINLQFYRGCAFLEFAKKMKGGQEKIDLLYDACAIFRAVTDDNPEHKAALEKWLDALEARHPLLDAEGKNDEANIAKQEAIEIQKRIKDL